MPRTKPPYPPEYRKRMFDLVRSGRTPEELEKEFGEEGPSAQSIRNWVKRADLDEGRADDEGERGAEEAAERESQVA